VFTPVEQELIRLVILVAVEKLHSVLLVQGNQIP
jgi:hypothetical protein